MKVPNTNLEQKCWMVVLVMIISAMGSTVLGVNDTWGKYILLVGIIGLTSFCVVAKKKKWITVQTKSDVK